MPYRPPKELLVATHRKVAGIGLVPIQMAQTVQAGVRGHSGIDDLTHEMGRDAKPTRSILMYNEDTKLLTMLVTSGDTEMAELQDLAHEVIERNQQAARKNGRPMNFAEMRESEGRPSADTFATRMQEAIQERINQHRANPVTDPFRQPTYPNPTDRKVFTQGENESWQ